MRRYISMNTRYYFQHPDTGHPMMLLSTPKGPTVESCDCECTQCDGASQAHVLCERIRTAQTIHSAAAMLRQDGCDLF